METVGQRFEVDEMEPGVPHPVFHLDYNHKDVTSWLTPFALSVSYVDHLQGESDGLEIQLDDRGGRWRGPWYPVKGDDVELAIGYEGRALLPCGSFQIDEIELSGPPSVVTLRALAAGVRKALRTKSTRAFEKQSLKQIAERLAGAHGLKVEGKIPDVAFSRVTQHRETDLTFAYRLAREHGAVFSVRGDRLIFHDLDGLEASRSVLVLEMEHLKAFSLRDKTHEVYGEAQAAAFDPETKQVLESTLKAQGKKAGDVLRIRKRAEHRGHVERQAKAAMKFTKGWEHAGTLEIRGEPRLMAGVNVELGDSFGVLSGRYQVTSARHTISRTEGFRTELEVRRV